MTDRLLLSALTVLFVHLCFSGQGQELKNAHVSSSITVDTPAPQITYVDSLQTAEFLRVETLHEDGTRSIVKQRVHPGGQPVAPAQRVQEIDAHLEAIASKRTYLEDDENLNERATESGWYLEMETITEQLEAERAALLSQMEADVE